MIHPSSVTVGTLKYWTVVLKSHDSSKVALLYANVGAYVGNLTVEPDP
jgi:hypothetical protein